VHALPEAFDPLGPRLRTSAERRVRRRSVSAHGVFAGHGALVEVGAQARHGVGEAAHADADERALLRPGQLFVTALHVGGALMLSLACAGLAKNEVQGNQEGDLHAEDGHAGRDGDSAPLHGPSFSDPWSGVRSAVASSAPVPVRTTDKGPGSFPAFRFSAWRRYQVRRDISSLSQGFLASMVLARSSIRGRPFFGAQLIRCTSRRSWPYP
jgi:hypothetical protein